MTSPDRAKYKIGQLVCLAPAVLVHAADTDVHDVVAAEQRVVLVYLHERVLEQFLRFVGRYPSGGDIVAIERPEVLVDSAERHCVAPLHDKREVAEPDKLQRVGKALGRAVCDPAAARGDLVEPLGYVAVLTAQRFGFLGIM